MTTRPSPGGPKARPMGNPTNAGEIKILLTVGVLASVIGGWAAVSGSDPAGETAVVSAGDAVTAAGAVRPPANAAPAPPAPAPTEPLRSVTLRPPAAGAPRPVTLTRSSR